MTNILLIGDPHFKVGNTDETDKFTKGVFDFLEEVGGVDMIVVMGDILHTHEKIHVKPLMRATKFLLALAMEVETYVLVGNHDRPDNAVFLTEEHSLFPLKFNNEDLEIIDKGYWNKKRGIVFVPYVEPGKFMEALGTLGIGEEELISGEIKAIFAHQEFKGAQMGGIVSLSGDEWKKEWPPVYSGHIHDHQTLPNGVTYIGMPYYSGYVNDEHSSVERRGVYTLEMETLTLRRIGLGMKPKVIRRVKISDILEYEFDEDLHEKLVIEGDTKEIRKILKEKEYRQKLKGVDYSIKEVKEFDKILPNERKIFTVPKIVEIIKGETKDRVEREILDDVFPITPLHPLHHQ